MNQEIKQSVMLPLSQLEPNKGQIEGLPQNPRNIKKDKFKKLKQSIIDNPEMLSLRELLVYPHEDKYIVIGGNMRYEAMKALKYKQAPCKVIDKDATVEQLQAYTIKDNGGFGDWDWDMLGNEWDNKPLEDWGLDIPTVEKETKRVNAYHYVSEQSTITGGCAMERNRMREQQQFELLQQKWGSNIVKRDKSNKGRSNKIKMPDYNPVIKPPIKGV